MFNSITEERPFRVYNPNGPIAATKIFGGDANGIRNWDKSLVEAWLSYQKALFAEYWVPEEVKMGKDIEQYKLVLSEPERIVYERVSGMLNWLDSMASDIVTLLFLSSSDPQLRTLLTLIASFETMHNVSYEHMTSSVIGVERKEEYFAKVQELPLLAKRNSHILTHLENMSDMLSTKLAKRENITFELNEIEILFKGIIAYQILEGLFFSGGFVYFHSLARDNKMLESNNMINLIKADENQHSEIFGLVVQVLVKENPELNTKENMNWAVDFIKEAVRLEKEWTEWLYEDIDTMSIEEYHNYAEYLANLICRNAGLQEPFPDNGDLRAKWIVTYGSKMTGSNEIAAKVDFLQGNAIGYKHKSDEEEMDF